MPRGRSSSSRGSSFSRGSSRSQSPPVQPQRPPVQQSMPQQRQGGMLSGIGSTIMTGMAFGAGSEVAHQAVRSVMGGGHSSQPQQYEQQPQQQAYEQPQTQQNPCLQYNNRFVECLQKEGEISSCQNLFDDLKTCERNMFK